MGKQRNAGEDIQRFRHRRFQERTGQMFSNAVYQAKKAGRLVCYTREDVRAMAHASLGKACPYCGDRLRISNMSLDHRQALSQGGEERLENLTMCCRPCQSRKGKLSTEEFMALLQCVSTWVPASRKDLFTRLTLGGANLKAMWMGKNRGERAVKADPPRPEPQPTPLFAEF